MYIPIRMVVQIITTLSNNTTHMALVSFKITILFRCQINISLEELNPLVPPTYSKLGMEIVPFVNAINPEETIPYCYQIFL